MKCWGTKQRIPTKLIKHLFNYCRWYSQGECPWSLPVVLYGYKLIPKGTKQIVGILRMGDWEHLETKMEKLISWTQDICQQTKIQKKDCTYKGHLEISGTYHISSHFIIFRLYIKQLLTQHISLLGYTLLPIHCKFLDGFTEPFFRCMHSHLCNSCHCQSSIPSWTQGCMQVLSLHKLQISGDENLMV
jgi:hypothetical protein